MSALFDKYIQLGGTELGKIVSGEIKVKGGGLRLEIEKEIHGSIDKISIYSHDDTGVHFVRGLIRRKWLDGGGVEELGYPLTDEEETRDHNGRYNMFQKGSNSSAVIYRRGEGGGTFIIRGPILEKWQNMDDVIGLGYPVTDEKVVGKDRKGRYNDFKSANAERDDVRSIYYHPRTGTKLVRGSIRTRWIREGWIDEVGYPKTDEEDYSVVNKNGEIRKGKISKFQRGEIVYIDGDTYYYATEGSKNPQKWFSTRSVIIALFLLVLGVAWGGTCIYALQAKNYSLLGILFPSGLITGLILAVLSDPLRRLGKKLFHIDD